MGVLVKIINYERDCLRKIWWVSHLFRTSTFSDRLFVMTIVEEGRNIDVVVSVFSCPLCQEGTKSPIDNFTDALIIWFVHLWNLLFYGIFESLFCQLRLMSEWSKAQTLLLRPKSLDQKAWTKKLGPKSLDQKAW